MIATLSGLSIGSLTMTPAFDSSVKSYTATTSNTRNKLTATPETGATVEITLNGVEVENGTNMEWEDGDNTIVITVSAPGASSTVYTVTVTKE